MPKLSKVKKQYEKDLKVLTREIQQLEIKLITTLTRPGTNNDVINGLEYLRKFIQLDPASKISHKEGDIGQYGKSQYDQYLNILDINGYKEIAKKIEQIDKQQPSHEAYHSHNPEQKKNAAKSDKKFVEKLKLAKSKHYNPSTNKIVSDTKQSIFSKIIDRIKSLFKKTPKDQPSTDTYDLASPKDFPNFPPQTPTSSNTLTNVASLKTSIPSPETASETEPSTLTPKAGG